jgi:hypothetical protein
MAFYATAKRIGSDCEGGENGKDETRRQWDRKRVAGAQGHEVRYEAKKTGKSKGEVKQAVKRAGPSRKKVENDLGKSSVQVALYS